MTCNIPSMLVFSSLNWLEITNWAQNETGLFCTRDIDASPLLKNSDSNRFPCFYTGRITNKRPDGRSEIGRRCHAHWTRSVYVNFWVNCPDRAPNFRLGSRTMQSTKKYSRVNEEAPEQKCNFGESAFKAKKKITLSKSGDLIVVLLVSSRLQFNVVCGS